MSVIHKTHWHSQFLVFKLIAPILNWSFIFSLVLFFNGQTAYGQPSEPPPNVQLQSMSVKELKNFHEEIVREHPMGQCLAWLAVDIENITTPIAIFDLWRDGAIMKTDGGFVFPVRAGTVDAKEIFRNKHGITYAFFHELFYITSFYEKNRKSISKNRHDISLRSTNLKIAAKKKSALLQMHNAESMREIFLY